MFNINISKILSLDIYDPEPDHFCKRFATFKTSAEPFHNEYFFQK